MRLYPLGDPAASVHHGGTVYKPGDDGGFDFPPDLEQHLHSIAVGGRKQWETAIERQQREIAAELARMRDPATLYEAVAKIVAAAEGKPEPAATPAPKGAESK